MLPHFDAADIGVPHVHFLHFDKQDVVQLLGTGLQLSLQTEHLLRPGQHLAVNDDSILLQSDRSQRQMLLFKVTHFNPGTFFSSLHAALVLAHVLHQLR